MIELYNGDCLEVMDMLIEQGVKVDAVITDPPYGTTACKWDTVIPLDKMWGCLTGITRPETAIVLHASQPFTSALIMSNIKHFKYDWIWRKPKGTGYLNAKKQPMRDKEDVLVFYVKQCAYNPQMSIGESYKNKHGKHNVGLKAMKEHYGNHKNVKNNNEGIRYPKQVLEFGVVERGTTHPTQKPVALMEYLIKTYTNENEIVLDFTMGSGTTGVACVNTGRSFIGIEKEPKYFEIAEKRIFGAMKENQEGTS